MTGYDVIAVLIVAETIVRLCDRALRHRKAEADARRKAALAVKEITP